MKTSGSVFSPGEFSASNVNMVIYILLCLFAAICSTGFIASLVLTLCFRIAKNAIVTKPDDALVTAGSRVVFNCSTDLKHPMNWWHTPVGSDESIEFYFLEGIAQTNEFYQSGFHVDTTIAGQYNLIIDNVTAVMLDDTIVMTAKGMNTFELLQNWMFSVRTDFKLIDHNKNHLTWDIVWTVKIRDCSIQSSMCPKKWVVRQPQSTLFDV